MLPSYYVKIHLYTGSTSNSGCLCDLMIEQREQFVKAVSSSSIQLFLEWFTSTQMFEVFINDELAGHSHGLSLCHCDCLSVCLSVIVSVTVCLSVSL